MRTFARVGMVALLAVQPSLVSASDAAAARSNDFSCVNGQQPVVAVVATPSFTDVALKARVQGVVQIGVIIAADGSVMEASVVTPRPMGLTHAAQDAARRWRFQPPSDESPCRAALLTFDFQLVPSGTAFFAHAVVTLPSTVVVLASEPPVNRTIP